MNRAARVADEIPRARRAVSPRALELLHRHVERVGDDDRDAGVGVGAEIARSDGDVNLAGAVHPDEAVRRIAAAVLLAESHADAAPHRARLLRRRLPACSSRSRRRRSAGRPRRRSPSAARWASRRCRSGRRRAGCFAGGTRADPCRCASATSSMCISRAKTACGCPKPRKLTADRRARVDAVAVIPVVRNPVGRDHALPGDADDGRAARGVATRSRDRLALERRNRAVLLHAGLQVEDERIARVFGEEQLLERVLEPDRPAGLAGQQRSDTLIERLAERVGALAAKATTDIGARSRERSCARDPVQGRSSPARRTRSVASPRTSRSRLPMPRRRHAARSAHDTGSA